MSLCASTIQTTITALRDQKSFFTVSLTCCAQTTVCILAVTDDPSFSPAFPETISISSSSESDGTLKEGQQYNFTCHIHNIAPVVNLTITWYKGDAITQTETLNRDDKKPTYQSSVFSFTPTKEDNNATFRCSAYMDLGPEGPQFNVSSPEYRIKVMCKYIICFPT